MEPPRSIAGLHAYGISSNRITSISVIHYFHHDGCIHQDVCIERPISRQQVWDNDVSNEMIMMNKMMSFLRGHVVYDEVDSDFTASSARARPLCRSWADGQRKVVVVTQTPMAAASTTIMTMLYTSKWTATEQSSEALGVVHPNVVKPVCRIPLCSSTRQALADNFHLCCRDNLCSSQAILV